MKAITIDDDLFLQIDKMATGIFSHSDVVRKLLGQKQDQLKPLPLAESKNVPAQKGSLVAFVQSPEYQSVKNVGERYLAILSWVHKNRPNEFSRIENFKRSSGKRLNFARSEKAILDSGKGHIKAKQISGSSVWALVTLDSPSMRSILADVLKLTGYQTDEIKAAVTTIPTGTRGQIMRDLLDGII